MTVHVHLIGGAGRIGTALTRSLVMERIDIVDKLWIYCDSTKAKEINRRMEGDEGVRVQARGYSAFSLTRQIEEGDAKENDSHVIFILRGVNEKVSWLNQPLKALDLHTEICRQITESNLWMYRNVSLVHMSSQLCDLIEGPASLEEICEGQESYRNPYMVSRLHQEAILTAHAFEHGISTCVVRLPAIYGFDDDSSSPWVLNTLCSQYRRNGVVIPRNKEREINLTHVVFLIRYLRRLIRESLRKESRLTVSFRRPPMLNMTVETLADLIAGQADNRRKVECEDLPISLCAEVGEGCVLQEHLKVLQDAIKGLLNDV